MPEGMTCCIKLLRFLKKPTTNTDKLQSENYWHDFNSFFVTKKFKNPCDFSIFAKELFFTYIMYRTFNKLANIQYGIEKGLQHYFLIDSTSHLMNTM